MAATTVSLDLQFRDAEHLRSEYHGFANLMNVVHAELQLLERMSGPEAGLRPSIRLCEAAAWSFKNPKVASEHGAALAEFRSRVLADLARVQATPAYEQDAEEAREIIRQVIDDADLRVQEMLARHGIPRATRVYDGETVRAMILGGVEDAPRRGRFPSEPGGRATDQLQVSAGDAVRVPYGLPEAVGRLAVQLLSFGGSVSVDVAPADATVAADARPAGVIAVGTEPLEIDLIPTHPPSSIDSSTPEATARALVGFISYLAGPEAYVAMDSGGRPLLLVRCRDA